ncbi:MAG: hypothetical protein GX857_00855 [Bacteroidales bacterium]|nr:hypothetical protein [Bacteroidales bacterium]
MFKTQDIWENQWEAFFQEVRDSDFKIFPTKTNFAKRIGTSYSTVMKTFVMYPESFVTINNMLADILVEGVALKYWQSGMIIFSMKNWCGWTDKRDTFNTDTTKKLVSKEDFKEELLDYMQREGIKVLPNTTKD